MKARIAFYLTIAITVVAFDVMFSLVSKALQINYVDFIFGSWILYAAAGFFVCRYLTFPEGILGGAVAGLSDSTAGWAVSSLIGPYMSQPQPDLSPVLILIVIVVVTGSGAFLGLVGALLSLLVIRLGYGRTAHP